MPIKFLFLLSITTVALAQEVDVQHKLFSYKLNFKENDLQLTGKGLDLSLQKTACNRALFERFKTEFQTLLKTMTSFKAENPDAIFIKSVIKSSYAPAGSAEGKFFMGVPDQIKTIKTWETLKCVN